MYWNTYLKLKQPYTMMFRISGKHFYWNLESFIYFYFVLNCIIYIQIYLPKMCKIYSLHIPSELVVISDGVSIQLQIIIYLDK